MKRFVLFFLIAIGVGMAFSLYSVNAQEVANNAGVQKKELTRTSSSKPKMLEVEEVIWYRLNENFLNMQNELVKTKADLKIAQAELESLRKAAKNSGNTKQTMVVTDSGQKKLSVHRVQKNDSLWKIAVKYYNDPYKWRWVYKANLKQLDDPNLIYPEQILDIPRY